MKPYKIIHAKKSAIPLVACIPHAGEYIPPEIATLIIEEHLR